MKSKVLIVDDQADVRDLLRSVLEDRLRRYPGRQRRGPAKMLSAGPPGRGAAGREIAGRGRP